MRRRLILSYVILTLVVLITLEVPLGISFADHQRDEIASKLLRDAFTLANFSAETLAGSDSVDLSLLVNRYTEETGGRVVIVDAQGAMRADSDPPVAGERSFASRPEISAALRGEVVSGTRRSSTLGAGLFYVAVPAMAGNELEGAVRITYPSDHIDAQIRRYTITLVAVGLVALGASIAIGVLFARWVSRPIENLTTASLRFGTGDLSARAPSTTGPPEVRELAGAFNSTALRLQELISAQEQFVADASHQLRTPLTALRLRLEMIEDSIESDEGDREQTAIDVTAAREEVQRLSRLVDGLLTLARADRQSDSGTAEQIDLDDFLTERSQAWALIAVDHDVEVVAIPSHLHTRATPDRLTQVLDNLLANAIEASPPHSRITLSASRPSHDSRGSSTTGDPGDPAKVGNRTNQDSSNQAHRADGVSGNDSKVIEIRVTDQGPGLADEIRDHAFDRFRRVGPSTSELGGTGLGLAIARKLINADGGSIDLIPNPDQGLTAVIRLPCP